MICFRFLLMLTVAWSLYDEFYGLRPWRTYQTRFAKAYSNYLDKDRSASAKDARNRRLFRHPEYKKLAAEADAARAAAKAKDDAIAQQIDLLDRQRAAIPTPSKMLAAKSAHLIYQLEIRFRRTTRAAKTPSSRN